MILVFILFRFL